MRGTSRHNLTLFARFRGLLVIIGLSLCVVQPSMASPQIQATTYQPCGVESAAAGSVAASTALAGAQPGATDPLGIPAGRYTLFPDQGVGSFQPTTSNAYQTLFYKTDGDATLSLGNSTVVKTSQTYTGNPIFAAAGKILTPDHDNLVYATRVGAPTQSGSVAISFAQEGPSVTLPEPLIPRPVNASDFIAIAQADLDKVPDQNGQPHNEVVVAHVSSEGGGYYRYTLDVLNYSSGNVSSPDITSFDVVDIAPYFNNSPQNGGHGVLPVDNTIALAVGDFDGDGNQEIALAALGDYTVYVYTFRYQTVNGVHSLNVLSSWFAGGYGFVVGSLSAAAGNLDGKGPDELILGYVDYGENPLRYIVSALVLKYSGATPVPVNTYSVTANPPPDKTFGVFTRPIVQIATGQFLFKPPTIALGTRQLAIAYTDDGVLTPPARLHIQMLSYSSDLSKATPLGPLFNDYPVVNIPASPIVSIAAGGFQGLNTLQTSGNNTPGAPLATLAVGLWTYPSYAYLGQTISQFWVQTFFVDPSLGPVLSNSVNKSFAFAPNLSARLPVVAYDLQGKSLYVGAPAHMTMTGTARTDVLLQEPPKHAYWDETSKSVVNLTRHDTNNVHLYNGSTSSFSTSSIDEASRNTGGSIALSAGATVGYKSSFFIGSASSQASVDVTIAGSYDYNENETNYNSSYGSRTISSRSSTDHDDFLSGEVQTFDVWRYRAYGAPASGETNTFYELVFPGPKLPFAGGGLTFDWYQPVHENGNILSYPSALGPPGNTFIPTDLGTITLPNGTQRQEPLVPAKMSSFNGSGTSDLLAFSSDVTVGKSFTYSHELAESADVTASYTASASVAGASGEVRACGSVAFHNSNSWGGSQTSNQTAKSETEIILNNAAGNASYAYPFYPVVYTTQDGTLKMASAVPNPGQKASNANYQTYANLYGGKQDPALNLPWRFDSYIITPGQVGWTPNLRTDRKQMRGLFFRQATVNDVSGTYEFLSMYPTAGDTVRIEARIYNYSTNFGAFGVPVQFEAIPYNSGTNSELCPNPINAASGKTAGLLCPPSERTVIGQTTIPSLNPLQWTCLDGVDDPNITFCAPPVYIDWDTTDFAGRYPGTAEYRIYVVLNGDGSAGPEIYGWEGNPVPITNVASTTPMAVTAPGNKFEYGDFVTIGGVQGLNQANGIFQIGEFSNSGDTFTLNTCQPSPPCAASSVPGRTPYSGGGAATLLDPGQNNEGYGYIGITTPLVQAADSAPVTPTDHLDYNSLEGVRTIGPLEGLLAESWVNAYLYDHQDLRFTAYSNTIHSDAAEVLLFDGDPATGAPAIAQKTIHPGANGADGESVWFDWQPMTPGLHKLFAVLVEGTGPQEKVELDVNVTNGNPASQ